MTTVAEEHDIRSHTTVGSARRGCQDGTRRSMHSAAVETIAAALVGGLTLQRVRAVVAALSRVAPEPAGEDVEGRLDLALLGDLRALEAVLEERAVLLSEQPESP